MRTVPSRSEMQPSTPVVGNTIKLFESSAHALRVLIVEDHALIRAGLRKLLESHPRFRVIGEVGSGSEGLPLLEDPDVAVVDIESGDEDELGVLSRLLDCHQHLRIVVLSSSEDSELHRRAVQLGATGVLLKSASAETFLAVVEHVGAGGVSLSRPMVTRLASAQPSATAATDQERRGYSKLTLLSKREREIVEVACEGLRNEEIARRLFISPVTVRHHLTAIFAKLGVPNRHSLIAYAYRGMRQAGAA